MRGWGIFCLILGIGSFILPYMGLQFRLLSLFGDKQPAVAVVLALVGAVMVGASIVSGESSE